MVSLTLAAQDDLAAIQQKLQQSIILATLDANGEIVTAGSVVTLQKSSLQMCGTVAPAGAGSPTNTYKNGKLSAGMFSWNLGLGLLKIDPNSIPMHTSVAGEKFWIVHYNVTKNHVEFKIWTDADANNVRYWTWLVIPFDKKQVPSPGEFMNTLAEVITLDNQGVQQAAEPATPAKTSAQDSGLAASSETYLSRVSSSQLTLSPDGSSMLVGGDGRRAPGHYSFLYGAKEEGSLLSVTPSGIGRSAVLKVQGDKLIDRDTREEWVRMEDAHAGAPEAVPPPPPPAPMPDIAPPPPPADATPPTIEVGQTMDQVTAGFGQPLKVAKLGVKTIFYYKDMKVTFTNGKVSNVE
ncbi:MAG: hypothetical protein ABR987_13950 [Terracidiphilus sp.]